jgi:hypothetical protein
VTATAARRNELALLEAAIEREAAAMAAESPAYGECACCPDCWRRTYMRERVEKQDRREAWAAVLRRKIARHNALRHP